MEIVLRNPCDLSEEQVNLWRGYQYEHANPLLLSPFFCPEYTRAVAAVRPRVQVAVLSVGGEPAGFFPFDRSRWNTARPVGLRLSDFSGPVVRKGVEWDAEELVRRCGLTGWGFRDVDASLAPLRPYQKVRIESAYIDLRRGFEHYQQERRATGSALVAEVMRKSRKMQREVGPLRLELRTTDTRSLTALIAWKSAQRRESGTINVLCLDWVVALLRRISSTQTEEFSGMLSALYAGDELAAVHLGMRSRRVLHYWLPAFNPRLQKYSPGSVFLMELARAAADLGVERIDLGHGKEPYKLRFKSDALAIAEGAVACSRASRVATDIWYRSRQWSVTSPMGVWLRPLKRLRYWFVACAREHRFGWKSTRNSAEARL